MNELDSAATRIEPATLEHASDVMQLISICIRQMREQGIFQWDEVYPNPQVVESDAASGALFLARRNGLILGTVCLNDAQPPEYRALPWRCGNGRALVIHRLCVHPDWQRCGVGRRLMDFTERFAAEHSFACIRLDAYTGNPRALALYERRGFHCVGQVLFPRRPLPFNCYEKILRPNPNPTGSA